MFLALLRQGSLKAAARDLGVNISTVSRRLDALEQGLGTHLFDRSSDGTHPTAAAEELVAFAETMEQAAADIGRASAARELDPEGVVRITAPPGLADQLLAPALPHLLAQHPKLRIELVSSIGYADLTRREADIALRAMRPTSGELISTKLVTVPFSLLCSSEHPAAAEPLAAVEDARWITWGEDLAHMPDAKWVAKHVPQQHVTLRTSSMSAQLEAARAGLGLVFAPDPFAELPGLCRARLEPELARRVAALPHSALWLVGHRALRSVPRIAVVWDWLKETFKL